MSPGSMTSLHPPHRRSNDWTGHFCHLIGIYKSFWDFFVWVEKLIWCSGQWTCNFSDCSSLLLNRGGNGRNSLGVVSYYLCCFYDPTDCGLSYFVDLINAIVNFLAARAVCWASSFISLATTAKPFPASPARAASMVAFKASKLTWSDISDIVSVTLLWYLHRLSAVRAHPFQGFSFSFSCFPYWDAPGWRFWISL